MASISELQAQAANSLLDTSPMFILATICVALFLNTINLSAVVVALPSIQQEFNVSVGDLQWAISAYALTFGVFLTAGSRAGNVFPHRSVLLVGLAVFAVFTLVSALSPTFAGLAVARGFQGIGAALTVPSAQAHITMYFQDPVARSNVFWTEGILASVGTLIGLVIGGAVSEDLTWRWIFWISLILSGALLPVAFFALPDRTTTAEELKVLPDSSAHRSGVKGIILEIVSAFDLPGLFLALTSALLFTYALASSNENGWSSAKVLAPLVFSLASTAAFGFYETQAERPMVPVHLFSSLSFDLTMFAAVLICAVSQACMVFLSLQLQYQGNSSLDTGLKLMPMAVAGLAFAAAGKQLVAVTGTRIMSATGWSLSIVGPIFLSFVSEDRSYWSSAFVGEILWATGFGAVYISANVDSISPPGQQAVSATAFNVASQVGGTVLGLGIVTAVGLGIGAEFGTSVADGTLPGIAFQAVYYSCAIFGFIGLISSFAIRQPLAHRSEAPAWPQLSEKLPSLGVGRYLIRHTTHDAEAGRRSFRPDSGDEWRSPLVQAAAPPGMTSAGCQTGRSLGPSRAPSTTESVWIRQARERELPVPPIPVAHSEAPANYLVRHTSSILRKQLHSSARQPAPTSRKNSFDQDATSAIQSPSDVPSPLDSGYQDTPTSFRGPTPFSRGPSNASRTYRRGAEETLPGNAWRVPPPSARTMAFEATSQPASRQPSQKHLVSRNNSYAASQAASPARPAPIATVETHVWSERAARSPSLRPGIARKARNNSYAPGNALDSGASTPTRPGARPPTRENSRSRSRGRHGGRGGAEGERQSWYTDREPLPGTARDDVAERDCNAAPQVVASTARRAAPAARPSAESVVERMREQGWEHSARLADAIAVAAAAKAAAGGIAAVPEPLSPPSVYSDDGMQELPTGASSQRTSWSSWHRTKTPKLNMSFSFEHLPAAEQPNRSRF